ncbi:MAG: hypothetical protein K6G87_02760 [Butyrivibrio sp.]|uniref:hypothetical protein n=1 Tax=Butyrivibrio sp. TaxID=28121 RepID=UPI0025E63F83|nr:hypothetical protein [Butyrivibrio sp.]MCR5770139.1 hypothetical protein [Butyrivibrio sp.]
MPDEIKMSVSGAVKNKSGQKVVYVTFEDKERSAEGVLPEGKILKNTGFTQEEIKALEQYMISQKDAIIQMARTVNPMKAFLSDGKNSHH